MLIRLCSLKLFLIALLSMPEIAQEGVSLKSIDTLDPTLKMLDPLSLRQVSLHVSNELLIGIEIKQIHLSI